MDTRTEIREFLTSRRPRITADQAGLPSYGSRRVPGLRHEEVAVLAGVSVPYHTRLERGDINGASDSVLDALARALQLDDAERSHLFDLACAAQPVISPRRRRPTKQQARPAVQHILGAITGAAAFVRNDRLGILGGNQLGFALYSEMFIGPVRPVNTARFVFLDLVPVEIEITPPWASHNVRFHLNGPKHFHHPVVGELSLNPERLDLAADSSLTIFTYTAEPGSRDDETFKLLGSWAAALDQADATHAVPDPA
ncbi:MAG: helix-turn-helix transcriptional regulator [Solirubrobacteraceae bacterium]